MEKLKENSKDPWKEKNRLLGMTEHELRQEAQSLQIQLEETRKANNTLQSTLDEMLSTKPTYKELKSQLKEKDKEIGKLKVHGAMINTKCSELQTENKELKDKLASYSSIIFSLQAELNSKNT